MTWGIEPKATWGIEPKGGRLIEAITFWAAVTVYVASSVLYLYGLVFKKEQALTIATYAAAVGFVPHSVALIVRWAAAGYPPVASSYETLAVVAWVAVLMFLALQWQFVKTRVLGAAILPISFIMMGLSRMPAQAVEPLSPSLKSYWLIIHAFFAELGHGSFIIATACALILLLKERAPQTTASYAFFDRFPSTDVLDDLSYRFITLGFILHAIMIVSGSIWANQAWGRYWGWDPVETWSLVTWLVYGVYLHLRLFRGWAGEKSAWLAVGAFVLVLFTFWGVGYVTPSIHRYLRL